MITGDLSFFYDSNALWNKYIPNDFRIIVINNQGGSIFRILPGDKSDTHFETFFETPHDLSVKYICDMYGLEFSQATDLECLTKEMKLFFEKSDRPKLIEIKTPRLENDKVLLNYFHFLKK